MAFSGFTTVFEPNVFDRHDLRVLRDAFERARQGLEQAGIADPDASSDLAKILFGSGRDLIHAGRGLKEDDAANLLAQSASRAMVELHALPTFA